MPVVKAPGSNLVGHGPLTLGRCPGPCVLELREPDRGELGDDTSPVLGAPR